MSLFSTLSTSQSPSDNDVETGELHPIAVLIEELRNEDSCARLKAIQKLKTIALALGPERTREELLPFIAETVYDEDDILLALATQLGSFVDLVGGKEYAFSLLAPLEALAAIEESLVRDKASEMLAKICAHDLMENHIEQYFLPVMKRLTDGDWFTNRYSACSLYPAAYPSVNPQIQTELRNRYRNLCGDDTPMVRRAAANHLGDLIRAMRNDEDPNTNEILLNDMLPMFNNLREDDQHSVRVSCVDTALAFAECLNNSSKFDTVFPAFIQLVSDKAWRVRHLLAEKFDKFQLEFGTANKDKSTIDVSSVDHMAHAFTTLLQDTEYEVRAAAAKQLKNFCQALDEHMMPIVQTMILPLLKKMVTDTNPTVKSSVATAIMELAQVVGKDMTVEELLPLFLSLLRDDCAEVRLNIISNLSSVDSVIGIDDLTESLLPAILELAADSKWRIRIAIVEHIPLLAEQLGKEVFEEQLSQLTLKLLTDPVYAIREAACKNLNKLVQLYGLQWAKEKVMPRIEKLSIDNNYLRRMTCLFSMTEMVLAVAKTANLNQEPPTPSTKQPDESANNPTLPEAKGDSDVPEKKSSPPSSDAIIFDSILTTILALHQDKIPNVRFNVAIAVEAMLGQFNSSQQSSVNSTLATLATDSDSDVCFFAQRAQKTLGFVQ